MKQARLVFTTLAVLMAWSVATAVACDQDKTTKASAAAVSSDASKCPYATAAQCKAAKASAAAHGACPYSASCPHTSAAACKAAMSTAVVAVENGSCSAAKATAVTASTDGASSAARTTAVTASSGSCCASKGAASAAAASAAGGSYSAAKSAAASGTCSHGAKSASALMVDGAGMSCNGHGMTTAAAPSMHGDCDACVDMADCQREIESAGASTQVVPLKNGVMYVYTADSPASVHAVQAALARRNDRMAQIASSSGSKVHLCGSCKEMRGAAASGKLSREVVNIEGGCLTLVTSNDPTIVAKIHAMAGITTAAKVKS